MVLVVAAALLLTGLVGADVTARPGTAGALAVPGWPPPTGALPGTAAVVAAVVAAERQITSLGAYSDARVFLNVAHSDADAAGAAFRRSVAQWKAAQERQARAVAAKAAATATVDLYDQALCELGVAEYTGLSVRDNLDLPSQEREVEQAELGDIAATDTATGLLNAKGELARSVSRLHAARSAVAAAKGVTVHKKALLGAAMAQLARSRRALALARQWALVPGKAPARPVVDLALIEGKVAVQPRAERMAALALVARPQTTAPLPAGTVTGAVTATTLTSTTLMSTTLMSTTTTITANRPGALAPAPGVVAVVRQAARAGLAASARASWAPLSCRRRRSRVGSHLQARRRTRWCRSTGSCRTTWKPAG